MVGVMHAPLRGMKILVQIIRNEQREGFAEETGAIRSMLEKDDLSIQSIE